MLKIESQFETLSIWKYMVNCVNDSQRVTKPDYGFLITSESSVYN